MEDWKEYKYTELASLIGGGTPKTTEASYWNGNIPWLSVKDFCGNSKYVYKTEKHITELGLRKSSTKLLHRGDIIISARGTVGEIAMLLYDMAFNQSCFGIRANVNVINNHYLYYLTKTKVRELQNSSHGSVFDTITKDTFENINCYIPNINEQIKIAAILSSFDDKIELNRRINGNLEQQAQALFKAWFVDFEPFKDGKFVDSELGRIPEGWKVGRFNNIIESTLSGDWGKERQEGNYIKKVFCLRGADIPDVKTGNIGYMPIRFILEKNFATKALTAGNLVIEISGGSPTQSTGRICRISHELLTKYNNSIVCTNFCKAIRPMVGYSSFMYYMWEKLYNEGVMFSYENGTTGIKNLDINGLTQKEPIIIPPIEVALNFEKYVDIYYNKIQKNGIESEQLSHLRDTLLPRLMSGELNVNTITE